MSGAPSGSHPAGMTSGEHAIVEEQQQRAITSSATLIDPKDGKPVDPNAPKCVGCGRYHGPPGEELRCLRAVVLRLRDEVAAQKMDERLGDQEGGSGDR